MMKFSDWLKTKLVVNIFQPLLNKRRIPKKYRRLSGFRQRLWDADKTCLTFIFENGMMEVQAFAPRVWRIITSFSSTKTTPFYDGKYFTFAVLEKKALPLSLEETDGMAVLKVSGEPSGLTVEINTDTAQALVRDRDTVLWDEPCPAASCKNWVKVVKRSPVAEHFLGFGQKTGSLFKNKATLIMWNTDNSDINPGSDPLYQSSPVAIFLREDGRAHGLFFDNPHYLVIKTKKKKNHSSLYCFAERGPLCLYILGGPSLSEVTNQLAFLTGTYRLPPLWVLGHHHSRWERVESASRIEKIAAEFRKRDIPCDAIHIDIAYMNGFRCFTWDQTRFPDPRRFIAALKHNHFHPVIITDPGLKKDTDWEIYCQGRDKGYFLKNPQGKVVHAPVWPGDAAFPDFFAPDAARWWGGLFKALTDTSVDGFWIDMNEPSVFTPRRTLPNTVIHSDRLKRVTRDHASLHNYYGFLMARATAEGLAKLRPGLRTFLFTRSSYTGIQRYASSWTGDNKSTWDHLRLTIPMIMNMGLCGQIMTGPDIGGFWGTPTMELFVRFLQCAAFFPFHRNHTADGTPPQEIWNFGPTAEAMCKKYLFLRYAFLPFLYTLLWHGSRTGEPIVQPLIFHFSDAPCFDSAVADTQYLCGKNLLVAPVLSKGRQSRSVYFPHGKTDDDCRWICFWTHSVYTGGTYETVPAALDTLPLFVKKGSVIPSAGPCTATNLLFDQPLWLDVYPDSQFFGELYIDDGASLAHQDGMFSLITVSGTDDGRRLAIRIERKEGRLDPPFHKWHTVHMRLARLNEDFSCAAMRINGKEVAKNAIIIDDKWYCVEFSSLVLPLTIEIMR